MADKKKFGLLIPKKTDRLKVQLNSVFNDESDDENTTKRPKIPQKKMETKIKIKTESLEDPSIYEYDNIYDEMKAKQKESIAPKEKKSSRYIETLLKAADKRKKEYERRIDRKIQVEREKEGDEFKDKEAFVTSSYKKKMEEKEEEEERERRENMLNDMMDVTKQKDLSGFYRHFLNQTVGEENVPIYGEKQIKKEVNSDTEEASQSKVSENANSDNIDKDSDGIDIDEDDGSSISFSSDGNSDTENKKNKLKKKTSKFSSLRCKRRKHNLTDTESKNIQSPESLESHSRNINEFSRSNVDSSEDEVNDAAVKISNANKYKKKDTNKHSFRHDSSSSDGEPNRATKDKISSVEAKKHDKRQTINKNDSRQDASSSEEEPNNKSITGNIELIELKDEKQSKINIYAKRTVGDVFAAAQTRYFQRMATRNSGIPH